MRNNTLKIHHESKWFSTWEARGFHTVVLVHWRGYQSIKIDSTHHSWVTIPYFSVVKSSQNGLAMSIWYVSLIVKMAKNMFLQGGLRICWRWSGLVHFVVLPPLGALALIFDKPTYIHNHTYVRTHNTRNIHNTHIYTQYTHTIHTKYTHIDIFIYTYTYTYTFIYVCTQTLQVCLF